MPAENENIIPQDELKSTFEEAAYLIFHPDMLPEFLAYEMYPTKRGELGSASHQARWASGMAELYTKSRSYRDFVSKAWLYSFSGLETKSGAEAMAKFKSRSIAIDASADAVLLTCRNALLANPRHPKWIAVIHFCLSRALASSAKKYFHDDSWSEASMATMKADQHYSAAECKAFGQVVTQVMPKYWEDKDVLAKMLGANAGVGLANMVALDVNSSFLQGIGAKPKH